jgi:hypothetical protein
MEYVRQVVTEYRAYMRAALGGSAFATAAALAITSPRAALLVAVICVGMFGGLIFSPIISVKAHAFRRRSAREAAKSFKHARKELERTSKTIRTEYRYGSKIVHKAAEPRIRSLSRHTRSITLLIKSEQAHGRRALEIASRGAWQFVTGYLRRVFR